MTSRDRRAVTLGLTIVVLLVGVRVVPPGLRALAQRRDHARQQVIAAAQVTRLLANRAVTRDSLRIALGDVVALAPKLLHGHAAKEAGATLRALVSLAAGRQEMMVSRIESMPDSTVGVFREARIRAELEGDIRGLTDFLGAIETAEPLLTVRALAIAAQDPDTTLERLQVTVDIAGIYLPRDSA